MTDITAKEVSELLIARIRAMQARTTANGCTEAEAMTAADMASRLIEQYQIDTTETEVEDEGVASATVKNGGARRMHEVDMVCMAIGGFCDCRVWRTKDTDGDVAVRFLGMASDVQMAEWLMVTVRSAMEREFLRWRMTAAAAAGGAHGKTLRASFMRGMASRVSARLESLRAARAPARATSGRELMVVKQGLIVREMVRMGLGASFGLHGVRGAASAGDGAARAAGRAAGDRVGFGRPVGSGGGAVAMIGRR